MSHHVGAENLSKCGLTDFRNGKPLAGEAPVPYSSQGLVRREPILGMEVNRPLSFRFPPAQEASYLHMRQCMVATL